MVSGLIIIDETNAIFDKIRSVTSHFVSIHELYWHFKKAEHSEGKFDKGNYNKCIIKLLLEICFNFAVETEKCKMAKSVQT